MTTSGVDSAAPRWTPVRSAVQSAVDSAAVDEAAGARPEPTSSRVVAPVTRQHGLNPQSHEQPDDFATPLPAPAQDRRPAASSGEVDLAEVYRVVAESRVGAESMAATASPATPASEATPITTSRFGQPAPVQHGSLIDRLV